LSQPTGVLPQLSRQRTAALPKSLFTIFVPGFSYLAAAWRERPVIPVGRTGDYLWERAMPAKKSRAWPVPTLNRWMSALAL
jgi:hypothetical protein